MYDGLHINSFRDYIFKVLTLIRFLITEPVVKGFLHLTSPLTTSDRALTQVYLDPRLLTPADEIHVDRICPHVFAAFLASVSHVQVVGLSFLSLCLFPSFWNPLFCEVLSRPLRRSKPQGKELVFTLVDCRTGQDEWQRIRGQPGAPALGTHRPRLGALLCDSLTV